MATPEPSLQPRRRVRRQRVPFPLTDGAELFEGGEILRDFDGDVAVVLWKSYKNVMLWAGAPAGERAGLFAEGAGERRRAELAAATPDVAIAVPLLEVAGLLDAPAAADPAVVGGACRQLSAWSAGRGAAASALLFMQAAALAFPADADAACAVGRMARERAEYARAETWFRQAIVAARETGDWSAYSRAYLGLAKVYWQRGALPTARRCMQRAYRAATRHHLTELRAFALWDLGAIAIHAGRWGETRSYIRAAVELVGGRHPSTVRLMNDVAYAWTTMGWYAPALRVLEAVAALPQAPAERVCIAGTLARAAGGAGEPALLDRAALVVEELSRDASAAAGVPDAWLDVAHGAATLGRWELAETAARRATALATARGEGRVRLDAEATLESVLGGRAARNAARAAQPEPLPETVSEIAHELAALAVAAGQEEPLVVAAAR